MDNDNIYPNSFPSFNNKKQLAHRKELSDVLKQLPLLKEVITHLDAQIKQLDSLDSIKVDITTDPITFQKIHAANILARDKLKSERGWLLSKIDTAR